MRPEVPMCSRVSEGAALWLPPGVAPDGERLVALINEHAPASIRPDTESVFEQMDRFHPKEPHWYLPLIGVDPASQSRGYGSALLAHALARSDRDCVAAYLESSNPRNVSLYQRHGFEILGEIQAGSSPRVVPMLRKPR
jgi:ribosomal protein S18 acetylase RimI-like enzyme